MNRFFVIVNPAAGRGRARQEWPGQAAALRDAGVSFEVAETREPGEAVGLAERAAREVDVVVAAGGDGTLHEVVNGLLRAGTRATLGVLPLGSGDDFVKMLPPRDPVERLTHGTARPYDAGRIVAGATRYFANGMDIGFGAHGAKNMTKVPPFLTGLGAYLGALALTLVRYPRLEVRLQLDDGPLYLLIARGCSRLDILALVPKIMRGSHAGDARLRMARARRVVIESEDPLLVEADGEIVCEDARRLEIQVLPGALRVLV